VFATAAQLASSPVSREKDWTDWSPRLVLDHKLDKNTLLFTSLSRGYQAGGFNIFTPPNPASTTNAGKDPSFEPEKMTNFEVGAKMVLPEPERHHQRLAVRLQVQEPAGYPTV
jgi:iron complex outermembrane receptor protein